MESYNGRSRLFILLRALWINDVLGVDTDARKKSGPICSFGGLV